jgi:predicted short-subunit dehydrogenase-like oxidoreductase (DUF2520 family)
MGPRLRGDDNMEVSQGTQYFNRHFQSHPILIRLGCRIQKSIAQALCCLYNKAMKNIPAKTVAIIGAGRLGKTLARLVVSASDYSLSGLYTRSASPQIGEVLTDTSILIQSSEHMQPADIYLITTPDDQIAAACDMLCHSSYLQPGNIILHCSGLHTAAILQSAKNHGCYTASIHPLRSFADPLQSYQAFPGTYCALEGDEAGLLETRKLFESFGGIVFSIASDEKALYHAASVFASNYTVTLYAVATQLLQDAQVSPEIASAMTQNLMQGTLNNLAYHTDPAQALTGPILRGDEQTLRAHLKSLQPATLKQLYAILGEHTLDLTKLSPEKKSAIQRILSS